MNFAPIILFVYNRLGHTQKTLEALGRNDLARESDLFIYSDGFKDENIRSKVEEVRGYIQEIKGFKSVTIVQREYNWGLANNIIDGATQIVNKYGKVIVLEDDLVTVPFFLTFMNHALDYYVEDRRIFCVTGYNYPALRMPLPNGYSDEIYFSQRPSSWGWATWQDRWGKAKWDMKIYQQDMKKREFRRQCNKLGDDFLRMFYLQIRGKINSWAIRWDISCLRNSGYCVYPVNSLVRNIGFDDSGKGLYRPDGKDV